MRKRNYLSNHDLLEEIHKSKSTFCSWLSEEDQQFDSILPNIDKVNIRSVAQAKRNRADRLAKAAYKEAYERGDKVKQAEFAIDWKKIDKTEVVFRIMTYDHVPLQPGRKKTIKTVADSHVQLNFPPFQHWRYTSDGELICVGKSHWEGGLENGWFNKEHGTLTNKLVRQFMKLIQRYAQRSNWRYYTYNDEMQGTALLNMSQMCLKFDESKSQNPFAYYTAVITNSFTRVLNTEKKGQKIRDDILEANGLNPSYTRQYENEESKNKEAKAEAAKT
jgi:hypothetical protein